MDGMKKGSGPNPFDEVVDGEEGQEDRDSQEGEQVAADTTSDSTATTEESLQTQPAAGDDSSPTESEGASSRSALSPDAGEATSSAFPSVPPETLAQEFTPDQYDLPHPWALGRDGATDFRTENKMFDLQEQVMDLESQARDEVEEILGDDVLVTDLREAAVIIGYTNPELLAELVSEWGADVA